MTAFPLEGKFVKMRRFYSKNQKTSRVTVYEFRGLYQVIYKRGYRRDWNDYSPWDDFKNVVRNSERLSARGVRIDTLTLCEYTIDDFTGVRISFVYEDKT